mgnify:CR=1 FL=1
MTVNQECKEGRITFNPRDRDNPSGPSVNLSSGLGSGYKCKAQLTSIQLHRDHALVVNKLPWRARDSTTYDKKPIAVVWDAVQGSGPS